MNELKKVARRITSTLAILVVMLGLIPQPFLGSVTIVFAQDDVTPVEEPAQLESAVSVDLSQPVEQAIVEQAIVEEAVVEEAVAEEAVVEEAASDEAVIEAAVVEQPVVEEAVVEETLPVDSVAPVSFEQVVEDLADAGVVLVDENQEPISLASTEAVQILSVPDPYFTRGGVIYRYLTDCTGYLTNCTVSAKPIQAAIDDVTANGLPDDGIIYVEKGIYEENLVITVDDLTLYGDPGNTTVSGVGVNAPTLEGINIGGDGITVQGVGISIIGFIIQNYQNAILLTPSGNSNFTAENNTIKNNNVGVYNKNAVPGIVLHYNEFENNTLAIQNDEVRGLQYIQAQNNYWGCADGPIVKYLDKDSKWVYVLWSTKAEIDPADYSGCQILYGENAKWDHQIKTADYSPFKINLDTNDPSIVDGCTDPTALNYNALATTDDGTCEFEEFEEVFGCTDITAINYDALATTDDGTCEFITEEPPTTSTPTDPGTPPTLVTFIENLFIPVTGNENLLIPITGADLGFQALIPFGGTLLLGVSFLVKGIYGKIKK